MAMPKRCSSHSLSQGSFFTLLNLSPKPKTVFSVLGPMAQVVSNASGSKMYLSDNVAYFDILRCSARAAADPGWMADSMRDEPLCVPVQVASQIKQRPMRYGKVVIPSGHFPLPLSRPTVSRTEPARSSARLKTSFKAA